MGNPAFTVKVPAFTATSTFLVQGMLQCSRSDGYRVPNPDVIQFEGGERRLIPMPHEVL